MHAMTMVVNAHHLEDILATYHQREYLPSDPLCWVHTFLHPVDQEIAAFFAAGLSYGRVSQIQATLQRLRESMDKERPETWLFRKKTLKLKHRFNTGEDLLLLKRLLCDIFQESGSLGAWFQSFQACSLEDLLNEAVACLRQRAEKLGAKKSFYYLIPRPASGSCCKRWCMLFRWMVRKDELDLGLWQSWFHPRDLVMPLDTHTGAIAKSWGLVHRKTLNWQSALEVTAWFRQFCPDDPVKYDFALCRLGMFKGGP
jgi:uncharacterized protein (TIGR02757 family)